jgi:hypothetical protein
MQADCTDNPFCVNCKKEGHLSAMCSIFSKMQEPFWPGFGGDGQGFYCCEVGDEELQKPASNAAAVCIESGSLSAEQLEEEFRDLVDEEWDWQVQKLSVSDFSLVFPSKESSHMAIRGGGLKIPTSKCHALVVINTGDPAATEHLVEVEVKLFGVPPPYRYSDRLLVGTRELGRPLSVDEESLADSNGPVRMTIACRSPIQLPESLMLFVNMEGFRVRVVRDGGRRRKLMLRLRHLPNLLLKMTTMKRPTRMLNVGTVAEAVTTAKIPRAKTCRDRGRPADPAGNQ